MSPEILLFFDRSPESIPLYEALESAILSLFPAASVRVQKTQISFDDPRLFACVSPPRSKIRTEDDPRMIVTFGLAYRLDSPRVQQAAEPYPGRWTHHVPLRNTDEIDTKLMGWITESHAFSRFRKK
ncbi:MAG: hypothetical protein IJE08_07050 [Clostridia bacterium]|nr:hypothetical protein [Clostridia bacterium]